jgi:hypothetical protein
MYGYIIHTFFKKQAIKKALPLAGLKILNVI